MKEDDESRLLEQIEKILSVENLSSDEFLAGAMDAEYYVPIRLLNRILEGTIPFTKLQETIKKSEVLALSPDQNKVRPAKLKARDTVLLRNIPSTAEPSVVEEIFKDSEFKLTHLEPGIGENWYCRFGSEDEAFKAASYIQSKKFGEKRLGARLKERDLITKKAPPAASAAELSPWLANRMGPGYEVGQPVFPFYSQPARPKNFHRRNKKKGGHRPGKRNTKGKKTEHRAKPKPANFGIGDFPPLTPEALAKKNKQEKAAAARSAAARSAAASEAEEKKPEATGEESAAVPLAGATEPKEPAPKTGPSWSDILKGGDN